MPPENNSMLRLNVHIFCSQLRSDPFLLAFEGSASLLAAFSASVKSDKAPRPLNRLKSAEGAAAGRLNGCRERVPGIASHVGIRIPARHSEQSQKEGKRNPRNSGRKTRIRSDQNREEHLLRILVKPEKAPRRRALPSRPDASYLSERVLPVSSPPQRRPRSVLKKSSTRTCKSSKHRVKRPNSASSVTGIHPPAHLLVSCFRLLRLAITCLIAFPRFTLLLPT